MFVGCLKLSGFCWYYDNKTAANVQFVVYTRAHTTGQPWGMVPPISPEEKHFLAKQILI